MDFELDSKVVGDDRVAASIERADFHSLISDFLVLISFAARQRCMCVGWDVRKGLSYDRYYRRDISIPMAERKRGWRDEIVDLADAEEFMTTAQSSFEQIDRKESVRRALNYAIPTKGETLESEFIGLYAALESLLSFFRDKEHFEILSVEDFGRLEGELKKWLKSNPLLEHKSEKRKLIYEKIRELNRISFATVFKRFCSQYSVEIITPCEAPTSRNFVTDASTFSIPTGRLYLLHSTAISTG